jgi:hypothetical protein
MPKNIIQITAADGCLFALCKDGTVWFKSHVGKHVESNWKQII